MPPIELTYKYALLPPTMGAEIVDQQIFEGHKYFNRLVELERERRVAYSQLMSKYADIECLEAMRSALKEDREAVRKEIKAHKAGTARKHGTIEQSARVGELNTQIKEVTALLQEAKATKKQDAAFAADLEAGNKIAEEAKKAARVATKTFWGTYLTVERSAKQASSAKGLPAFKRWKGYGHVGIQLQRGLSVERAESCLDPRFQLDLQPRPCATSWSRADGQPPRRAHKPLPRIRIRIYDAEAEEDTAEWPIILHRPLPRDATITWVKVIRQPMPGKKHHRWTLHVSLLRPTPVPAVEGGIVAVDVGWRRLEDGGLRSAYVLGDDGEGRPVELGSRAHGGLTKAQDIQSIRDKHVDELKEWLGPWIKRNREEGPNWFKEATKCFEKWQSPRRFHKLAHCIREVDDGFLDEIRDRLEEWRKHDKHLYCYQSHQRDQAQANRLDMYRKLAFDLSNRYKVLVLEDFNLTVMGRKENVESQKEDKQNRTARRQARMAAPGELRDCLKHAFAKAGGIVALVPPQYTSKRCHVCRVISPWDDPGELVHQCSACGATWDRDENACHNLLYMYRERSTDAWSGTPLKITDYSENTPRKEGHFQRLARLKKEKREALAKTTNAATI